MVVGVAKAVATQTEYREIRAMVERALTYDEIINKMDYGEGYMCLCGQGIIESKTGYALCEACGREYQLCIGIIGGWVNEKMNRNFGRVLLPPRLEYGG